MDQILLIHLIVPKNDLLKSCFYYFFWNHPIQSYYTIAVIDLIRQFIKEKKNIYIYYSFTKKYPIG